MKKLFFILASIAPIAQAMHTDTEYEKSVPRRVWDLSKVSQSIPTIHLHKATELSDYISSTADLLRIRESRNVHPIVRILLEKKQIYIYIDPHGIGYMFKELHDDIPCCTQSNVIKRKFPLNRISQLKCPTQNITFHVANDMNRLYFFHRLLGCQSINNTMSFKHAASAATQDQATDETTRPQ